MNDQRNVSKPDPAIWAAFISVLLAPLLTVAILFKYSSTFGWSVSTDHSRWAEFGGFFGGLISPIISILAVAVVVIVLWVQKREFSKSLEYMTSQLEQSESQATRTEMLGVLSRVEERISHILEEQTAVGKLKDVARYAEMLQERKATWCSAEYYQYLSRARTIGSTEYAQIAAIESLREIAEHAENALGKDRRQLSYFRKRIEGLNPLISHVHDKA